VIVHLPAACGEQVTGALTDVALGWALPTKLSIRVLCTWDGTASKPALAEALPPSPKIVTSQLRSWLCSAGVITWVAPVAPLIGTVSRSQL
jgi:hypothetical protein